MELSSLLQPASDNYANHLAGPTPERLAPAPAYWLLAVLVLLCLIPRAAMALRIPSICPDGVLYVRVIQSSVHYELDRNWKPRIIEKLKARFGARRVRDIRFRIG